MVIRESRDEDFKGLLEVDKQAFGDDEGPEIVELFKALFADPTAKPLLSLVALDKQLVKGHIMFTKAKIDANDHSCRKRGKRLEETICDHGSWKGLF